MPRSRSENSGCEEPGLPNTCSQLSDQDLVAACIEGDEAAWNAFIERFDELIALIALRTARRWGQSGRETVADLIQEVYLKLCRDNCRLLRSFAPQRDGAWFAYIKKVTANLVHDHFRTQTAKRRGGAYPPTELRPEAADAGSTDVESRVALLEIDGILRDGSVSERDRQIFWLYHKQGFTAKEISHLRAVDMSVKGVESTLHRTISLVRERLDALGQKRRSLGEV